MSRSQSTSQRRNASTDVCQLCGYFEIFIFLISQILFWHFSNAFKGRRREERQTGKKNRTEKRMTSVCVCVFEAALMHL